MSKLMDFCKNITDGEHNTVPKYKNTGYYLLANENLIDGTVNFSINDREISLEDFSKIYKRCKIEDGDILISTVGEIGKLAIVENYNNNYVFQRSVGLIKTDKNKLNPYFLYYLLSSKSIQKKMKYVSYGSMQKGLTLDTLKNLDINCPKSVNEQKERIKSLFLIDKQIKRNNDMVQKLQVLTQAIYNYWFIQYKIPNFKSDLIYNKNLNRKIPLNWKVKKISEVCNIILGGTPSTKIAEYWKGDINWLNSGEIAHFPITKSELKISNLGLKNSATKLMKKGTILVSITGNIRVSILAIDSCANQSVVGIEENDVFEAGYLYPCVKNLIELYEKTSTGNCQKHINKNAIEHSYLLIPPYDILQKYSEYIRPFYKKIYDISLLNEKLLLLKNTLLPLLINQQLT